MSVSRAVTYHPKLKVNYELPPVLSIRKQEINQVRLSWPTNATGFVLRRAVTPNGNYTNANLALTTEANETVAYDAVQSVPGFYRLAYQP